MNKHLAGRHDQLSHGHIAKDLPPTVYVVLANLWGPKHPVSGVAGTRFFNNLFNYPGAKLTHVEAKYPGTPDYRQTDYSVGLQIELADKSKLGVFCRRNADKDKDLGVEIYPVEVHHVDTMVDFIKHVINTATNSKADYIGTPIQSMPMQVAAELGFNFRVVPADTWPATGPKPAGNLARVAGNFLQKTHDLEKVPAAFVKSLNEKYPTVDKLPVKTLYDMPHPLYPEVPLFAEFMSSKDLQFPGVDEEMNDDLYYQIDL